jgi:HD-like signal output (HDOD) protein
MPAFDSFVVPDALPTLSTTVRQLLSLSKAEREDLRLLGLIAQKDPVILARLLTMANVAPERPENRTLESVQQAIAVLGPEQAYTTMVVLSQAQEFSRHPSDIVTQQYLLRQAVNVSLTARRLARLLQLTPDQTQSTFLAALIDVLGLYALLVADHPWHDKTAALLCEHARKHAPLPRNNEWLEGYRLVSTRLAEKWEAGPTVAATLSGELVPGGHTQLPTTVLGLAHELVAAKLENARPREAAFSGLAAVREASSGAPCRDPSALMGLDLAFVV